MSGVLFFSHTIYPAPIGSCFSRHSSEAKISISSFLDDAELAAKHRSFSLAFFDTCSALFWRTSIHETVLFRTYLDPCVCVCVCTKYTMSPLSTLCDHIIISPSGVKDRSTQHRLRSWERAATRHHRDLGGECETLASRQKNLYIRNTGIMAPPLIIQLLHNYRYVTCNVQRERDERQRKKGKRHGNGKERYSVYR